MYLYIYFKRVFLKILQTNQLSKKYGRIQALDNLDLIVNSGEVLGILGPNGSGKTTTLSIVLNAIFADSGTYSWFDKSPNPDVLKRVGALLETPNFYPQLTAVQNLKIIAHIRGVGLDDMDDVLNLVNLSDRKNYKFGSFSYGMKQRLAIAAVMLGDPEVLIFDEPTNGLDPKGIVEVREIMVRLAATGRTIIMASHILDEVEKICSHVAILNKGRLLAQGKIGEILNTSPILELCSTDLGKLKKWLDSVDWCTSWSESNGLVQVLAAGNVESSEVNAQAFENGIVLSHIQSKKPRLEDEFIHLIDNA